MKDNEPTQEELDLAEYVEENYNETDDYLSLDQEEEDYTHGRPLLAFTGPSDLPREENRRWFTLVITASVLLILFALLFQQILLAIILIGVAWLTYMLTRIPNQEVENVITSTGFFSQDKFYPWSQLNGFWIIKDHGHYVLGLETDRRAFSNVMILLGSQNPIEVKQVLSQYIPYREDHRPDILSVMMEKGAILLDNFYASVGTRTKEWLNQQKEKRSRTQSNPGKRISSADNLDDTVGKWSEATSQTNQAEDTPSPAQQEPDTTQDVDTNTPEKAKEPSKKKVDSKKK